MPLDKCMELHTVTPVAPKPRQRVLYVITRGERGGAQAHVLELIRAAREHFDVALAIGDGAYLTDAAGNLGVRVFQVPNLVVPVHPGKDARAIRDLRRIIRRFQPDLMHAHSSKAGFLTRIAAYLENVPCIFTAHGWAFTDGTSLARKTIAVLAEWVGAQLGSATIAVSHYDYELALRYHIVGRGPIFAVQNGIEDNPYRARPDAGDPPVVTMVARFTAQKDHATLLHALSDIHAPFRLQLVGDGPLLCEARTLANRLGLAGRTEFLGERSDVAELLAHSDVFALASMYEGLPISILEAMRAGLPVVASRVGGVGELVLDGVNGFSVRRGNIAEFRNRLETLLLHAAMRKQFGNRSRRLFEENFTRGAMLERTFRIYSNVLERAHVPYGD